MERGQGDSWRPQCLEALHGCPMLHKELKDLMMILMINLSSAHNIYQRAGRNRMGLTVVTYRKGSWINK